MTFDASREPRTYSWYVAPSSEPLQYPYRGIPQTLRIYHGRPSRRGDLVFCTTLHNAELLRRTIRLDALTVILDRTKCILEVRPRTDSPGHWLTLELDALVSTDPQTEETPAHQAPTGKLVELIKERQRRREAIKRRMLARAAQWVEAIQPTDPGGGKGGGGRGAS